MEEAVLGLYAGHEFLGGRAVAHRLRTEAERILRSDPKAIVVLDFCRVEGVSHSFGDELLSALADCLGEGTPNRVFLANCSRQVFADLNSVARMHQLPMLARRRKHHRGRPLKVSASAA